MQPDKPDVELDFDEIKRQLDARNNVNKQPSTAVTIVALVLYTSMAMIVGGVLTWLIFFQ